MLIKKRVLDGIAKGKISLAFRRWRRPTVKSGGRLRTAVGQLAILAVDRVDEGAISEQDAVLAGHPSRDDLLRELSSGVGTLYRIRLRLAGPDSRATLREKTAFSAEEYAEVLRQLKRYDSNAATGAWTLRVLRQIAAQPGVRASELAKTSGFEKDWLKANIRKLKEHGLTESLTLGYRLPSRASASRASGTRVRLTNRPTGPPPDCGGSIWFTDREAARARLPDPDKRSYTVITMPPKTRIVRIGNSRGIRITKALLNEADLPEEVELHAEPGRLVIQASRRPRSGWAAAAKRMRARGDDRLLDQSTSTTFDHEEWEWR